jgi:hypothetical protein
MQAQEHAFDEDTVYRRTRQGGAALLSLPSTLSETALALLARVNGFTDLGTLVDQEGDALPQVAPAVEALLQQQLIEAVAPTLPPAAVMRAAAGTFAA